VLVLKKFNKNLLWVLPLTSQSKTGNYYHQFEFNGKFSFIILVQLRVISSKRLIRKIGTLSVDNFNEVRKKVKTLL
jgi:hypothetical protein